MTKGDRSRRKVSAGIHSSSVEASAVETYGKTGTWAVPELRELITREEREHGPAVDLHDQLDDRWRVALEIETSWSLLRSPQDAVADPVAKVELLPLVSMKDQGLRVQVETNQ